MSATHRYRDHRADVVTQKHELLEIRRSRVSLRRAKAGYSYPMIRLPYTFSMLAGLPTCIYQTVRQRSACIASGRGAYLTALVLVMYLLL